MFSQFIKASRLKGSTEILQSKKHPFSLRAEWQQAAAHKTNRCFVVFFFSFIDNCLSDQLHTKQVYYQGSEKVPCRICLDKGHIK